MFPVCATPSTITPDSYDGTMETFTVTTGTVLLTLDSGLDYEVNTTYSVVMETVDTGKTPPLTGTITVKVRMMENYLLLLKKHNIVLFTFTGYCYQLQDASFVKMTWLNMYQWMPKFKQCDDLKCNLCFLQWNIFIVLRLFCTFLYRREREGKFSNLRYFLIPFAAFELITL